MMFIFFKDTDRKYIHTQLMDVNYYAFGGMYLDNIY